MDWLLYKIMKEEKEYLTQEKYDQFAKELEYLKGDRRKEVAENLEYAKSLGDLSENAEYHEARDNQAAVEDRIVKLETLLKSASIVTSEHTTDIVGVGSLVSVQKENDKNTKSFTLVGTEEADTSTGKISVRSPLGASVLGRKKGESFAVSTPKGVVHYKLISVK